MEEYCRSMTESLLKSHDANTQSLKGRRFHDQSIIQIIEYFIIDLVSFSALVRK